LLDGDPLATQLRHSDTSSPALRFDPLIKRVFLSGTTPDASGPASKRTGHSPKALALQYKITTFADVFCGRFPYGKGTGMAISRLLANKALAPGERERLTEAYELTLHKVGLVDRNDPVTEIIANKIIEIGQSGVFTPEQISRLAIEDLGMV
jgi:hypothetical protein